MAIRSADENQQLHTGWIARHVSKLENSLTIWCIGWTQFVCRCFYLGAFRWVAFYFWYFLVVFEFQSNPNFQFLCFGNCDFVRNASSLADSVARWMCWNVLWLHWWHPCSAFPSRAYCELWTQKRSMPSLRHARMRGHTTSGFATKKATCQIRAFRPTWDC